MFDFKSRAMSNSAMVVEVSGLLSETNRTWFFDCIRDYIKAGYKHIIIECHRLGYMNSAGLTHFLRARKRSKIAGAKIYLTHLDSSMGELLEITKLGRILAVYPTTKDVIDSIENKLACVG